MWAKGSNSARGKKLDALQAYLGLSGKQLLGLTGLIALFSPKSALVYGGYNVFKKLITSPKFRQMFRKVASLQRDFNQWVKSWGALMNALEE